MDLTTHEIRRCEAFIVQADQWLVEQPLPTFGQYLASSFCHLLRRIEVLWLMLTTHHKKLIGEFAERLKNKSWTNEYLDCLTTVQIQKLGKKFLYQNKEEPLQAVARATNKADKIALAALFAGNRGVIRNHAQFPKVGAVKNALRALSFEDRLELYRNDTSLEAQLEPELVVQRSISNCINHNEQILIKPSDVDPEEVLVLNLSDMRGLTPNLCEQIAKLYPNIHTLNLSNTGINDDHLTALSNLEMLTQLTVSHTQIRGLAFAHFTTLKIVDCSDCAALVDEAINNLEKCSLAELNIGCTSITGIHFDKLDSNISKLSLFNCKNVTDESLKKLEETLIEELTVAQTNIQGLHLHLLDSLKRLDVSGCAHLTFEAIRLLKNIPPLELLLIPANFWQRPGGQAARERICQEFAVVNKGNLVNALLE